METTLQLETASVSDRGLSDKRPQNEDSFLELRDLGVFAVADGVGGAQAGDVASQMAMEILGEAFANMAGRDGEEIMRLAIDQANSAIYQMANDLPQLSSMATTIVALYLRDDVATIAHVGDSRLYQIDLTGSLSRETDDHSVVEEEVRAGRMTPEEAAIHPSRNVISRALGAEATVDIDLKTVIVEPGTTFLLCSDGITRHVADSELAQIAASGLSADALCKTLKEICYERGAEDNLTAVVVRTAAGAAVAAAGSAGAAPDDETTIARARSPFDSTVSDEDEIFDAEDEFPTRDFTFDEEEERDTFLPIEDDEDDDSFLMIETEPDKPELKTVEAEAPAGNTTETMEAVSPLQEDRGIITEQSSNAASKSGSIAKAAGAVVLILLGALAGAGGYYYWQKANPEPVPVAQPPVITEMKTTNPALTGFEESRRLVDDAPEKYIAANSASPQDAEDHFLLGRAYMLTGKYWEAKRAFNEAKSKMPPADPKNLKTLEAEIAMALAIIESPKATEIFSRDAVKANVASSDHSPIVPPR